MGNYHHYVNDSSSNYGCNDYECPTCYPDDAATDDDYKHYDDIFGSYDDDFNDEHDDDIPVHDYYNEQCGDYDCPCYKPIVGINGRFAVVFNNRTQYNNHNTGVANKHDIHRAIGRPCLFCEFYP
jgi:hypothetical protein